MNCPECNVKAFTKATRSVPGNKMRRRYQCPICNTRFSTEESVTTDAAEGRDSFGRFAARNKPAPQREHLPSCGSCNHWLHDGCALQLRPASRSRRFSRACDDFLTRYGPEAPATIGRQFPARYLRLKKTQLGDLMRPETVPPVEPEPVVFDGRLCRSCAFSWGGRCDLGLPKPSGKKCGKYVSALTVGEVA